AQMLHLQRGIAHVDLAVVEHVSDPLAHLVGPDGRHDVAGHVPRHAGPGEEHEEEEEAAETADGDAVPPLARVPVLLLVAAAAAAASAGSLAAGAPEDADDGQEEGHDGACVIRREDGTRMTVFTYQAKLQHTAQRT